MRLVNTPIVVPPFPPTLSIRFAATSAPERRSALDEPSTSERRRPDAIPVE
jgi:hypothetical protein